jgi:hypothetical protein
MIICKDCIFFEIIDRREDRKTLGLAGVLTETQYSCHRYPERYAPYLDYWCGEGKDKDGNKNN